jgi:DNA-binding SARP family transcriptional activator/predicted ATPase
MSHLAIFALGPLRIELDGQPLQTSRHKALALLVFLAMNPGEKTRKQLSAFLWPEYEQEKAYAYLRRTIWELHNLLGEGWLDTDREKICLHPGTDIYLDISRFQAYLEAFRNHHHPDAPVCQECFANLNKANLLYRGDFLADFSLRDSVSFEDWQLFQREALQREYAEALQKLAHLSQQARSYSEAISFAQHWLMLDSLNEAAHRFLMKAYAENGQRHNALRQYQECQRILQAELGISPEPGTTALYEAIVSGKNNLEDVTLASISMQPEQKDSESDLLKVWQNELPATQVARSSSSLPFPATKFIGRQKELEQITNLLSQPDCWLLTILGPGGIGKTRLAIEVGQTQLGRFPQGVFFIPLDAVDDQQSIAPAIARSVGLVLRQNGSSPAEQIIDFLRKKYLLMILDSFEGLLPSASMLMEFHFYAPEVKMLVTSRRRLHVQGEWVLELGGLDYPQKPSDAPENPLIDTYQAYSAIELFLQAARRTRIDFQASMDDLLAIGQIARLLDGMPLGLELAATWISTISCRDIAQEIGRGLDLLELATDDFPQQNSIRAVFDRSWRMLTEREKILLPRLSVFQGSFTRQAAEQVADISLQELARLVDQTLVRRLPNGRFGLHDLLRQYNAQRLAQQPSEHQDTCNRHCSYYCARLAEWNIRLNGEKQGQVLREIETEFGNLQTAWEWATSHEQLMQLAQAVDGLGMLYLRRALFSEGRASFLNTATALNAGLDKLDHLLLAHLSARLHIWQAVFSLNLERFEEADQSLQESQNILDHAAEDQLQVQPECIFELTIRALLGNLRYEVASTPSTFQRAIAFSMQSTGKAPRFFIFFWRFLMGGGAVSREIYLEVEKNLALIRQSGNPFESGCTLFVLGIAELFHFYHMDKAESLLTESCRSFQQVDDPSTTGMVSMALGYLLLAQGKFEDYYTLKLQELEIYQDIGDRRKIGIAHAEIGEVFYHLGRCQEAEDRIRLGMSFLRDLSDSEYALRHRYLGDTLLALGRCQEALNAYQFSYLFFQSVNDKGWMLTALTGLSRAEFALGDRANAWRHALQALQLYCEMKLFTFFAYLSLAEIALLLADQGEVVQALELYSLVLRQGYLGQSRWFADLFGRFIEDACAKLSLDEQKAARKRGQALDFSTAVSMILAGHKS